MNDTPTAPALGCRPVSDAVEELDQPLTQQQAAQMIMNYFLANAEAGDHAANDALIAELARRRVRTGGDESSIPH